MSLVAYESSDDSQDELQANTNDNTVDSTLDNFAQVNKKQRGTVKISIPSLKEFKEECDEIPDKKPKMKSGCSLFSLLPPPKNASTLCKPGFTPHILSKKKDPETKQNFNKSKNHCTPKASSTSLKVSSKDNNSDDEDNQTEVQMEAENNVSSTTDYFFLNKIHEMKESDHSKFSEHAENYAATSSSDLSDISGTLAVETEPSSQASSSTMYNEPVQTEIALQSLTSPIEYNNDEPVASDISSFIKDKEFIKLQGRKRELAEIDIIDVSADDQLTGKNEWLMKSLTEEKDMRPHKRKNDMPTQQQKRKHQITYLAFQAKERELDLKNQWALNSRTRRETQAKYGF